MRQLALRFNDNDAFVAVTGWFTLLQRHTKDTAMADARRVEGQALTLEQAMAQALEVAG